MTTTLEPLQAPRLARPYFALGNLLSAALLSAALLLTGCSSTEGTAITTGNHNLQTQTFQVDAAKGGVINGVNGSIFAIPENAFLDANGNLVAGEVEIHLQEANTMKDILMGGLITQTGNELLASDGMYKIEASRNGESLQLDPSVGIYAYLPADGRDPDMGLYAGNVSASKLDWELTNQTEEALPDPNDKANKKQCKKCKNLLKMAKNIKPGKKPGKDEYYAKRHYWENGMLYFASSGGSQPILSKKLLEECESFLKSSRAGQNLLAELEAIKRSQKEEAGAYYTFRIENLGWYNIDKLVKNEIIAFTGRVVDPAGDPVAGSEVHLISVDKDLRVHTATTAEDGTYSLKFAKGKPFRIYAFNGAKVGKKELKATYDGQSLESLAIQPLEEGEMDGFLADLM